MDLVNRIAGLFGIDLKKIVHRIERNVILVALSIVLVVVAVTFGLVALYVWLTGWIGAIWSALLIAGVALVLALILLLAMQISGTAEKRRQAEKEKMQDQTMRFTAIALATLPEILRSPAVRRLGIPMAVVATLVTLGLVGDRSVDEDED